MAGALHVLATPGGNRELRGANPALPWGDSTPPPPSFGSGNVGGVAVTQQAALGIAAVYGSVRVIGDAVATLPMRILDKPTLSTANELPTSQLLTQPYAEIPRVEWFAQATASLALRGEFLGWIIDRAPRTLYAQQIMPIPVDSATVRRNQQTGTIEYRFFGKLVNPADVFHIKYQSMPGMLRGISPVDCLRYAFGLALAQERHAESFFSNSANPSLVIEVPGFLDDNEAQTLARNWIGAHQGIPKANLPAVVTDGASVKALSLTPEQSQFIQSRGFTQQQICGTVFGVPPHMVGIVDRTTSWGTGIEQQERGFVMNTLMGYLARLEEALTALHPPGQFVSFNLNHRVKGDTLQRAQAGSLMMLAGAWCADDVRALFDMPPLPSGAGKKTYVPINTELYQMALQQLKDAQKPQVQQPPAPFDDGE